MQVLMRVPVDSMPDKESLRLRRQDSLDEAANILFDAVNDQYNEQADCDDAYLHTYDSQENLAENLNLVLGLLDPDAIRRMASQWNSRVQKDFDIAVKGLAKKLIPLDDGTYPWLDGSSTDIYAMKKAAMALDGQFYDFADHTLLVNNAWYFTTVLTTTELSDIMQHPENYAAIEVSPK